MGAYSRSLVPGILQHSDESSEQILFTTQRSIFTSQSCDSSGVQTGVDVLASRCGDSDCCQMPHI